MVTFTSSFFGGARSSLQSVSQVRSVDLFSLLLVVVVSAVVTVPSFAKFHKTTLVCFHWNFSVLDKVSMASALDDSKVVYDMLLLTLFYSLVAYGFLASFCYEMSQTEFTSTEQFIDKFVAKHAVFIRGVNTQIGTKTVQSKVKKVFEQRFGKGEVVATHAYRNSGKAHKIFKQIKATKLKLDELYTCYKETGDRGKRKQGSNVDAIQYYEAKLEAALAKWKECANSHHHKNQGIVVVVLKDPENVQVTIDELERVKTRLIDKSHLKQLHLQDWQVSEGHVANDIIWTNIGIYMQTQQSECSAIIGPIFISCFVVFTGLLIESIAIHFFPTL